MSQVNNSSNKSISQTDVLSSAAISAILTFTLLSLSKDIDANHWSATFLTDQMISFIAGASSVAITFLLSVIRFRVNLTKHEWTSSRKLKFIDKLIQTSNCEDTKKSLEQQKNKLLLDTAKDALEEAL